MGYWYYLDGLGRERGLSLFSDLQSLVDKGVTKKYSSVFRKCDKLWVPVASSTETYDVSLKSHQESSSVTGDFPVTLIFEEGDTHAS